MRTLIVARNRAVGVEGGRIVANDGPFDLILEMPDADVRPGLINAHDHLHRNHYGRLGAPPYRNAYEWAEDIQERHRARIAECRAMPRREALLAGAWKNLFAGVTAVMHHDDWEPDFDRDFPLRIIRAGNADSLGMSPALDAGDACDEGPFCLHVAEGIDARAADEIRTLDARGLLDPRLIAVHGVGMDQEGIALFRASGAALTWCPTSNAFLFGRGAPAALLDEGLDVLLGSDSLLTGAGDLLHELLHARSLGHVSDARLEDAVGAVAARRFGLPLPSLDPGADADLVLLARPLLEASAGDVALTMVGGMPRVARGDLVPRLGAFGAGWREMEVGGVVRWTSNDSL